MKKMHILTNPQYYCGINSSREFTLKPSPTTRANSPTLSLILPSRLSAHPNHFQSAKLFLFSFNNKQQWRKENGSRNQLNIYFLWCLLYFFSIANNVNWLFITFSSFQIFPVYASNGELDVTDDGESSLYNGDENHKIWNGSHEQLNGHHHTNGNGENHYDFYSNGINGTSTIGRPSRQRQISVPVPVPPPPKEEIKKKKESKKSSSKSVGSQSLSGTLIRPRPIHPGEYI